MRRCSMKMRTIAVSVVIAGVAILAGMRWLGQRPEVLPAVQEVLKKPVAPKTHKELKEEAKKDIDGKKAEAKANTVTVDLSTLGKYKLSGLYATYLGLPKGEQVPSQVTVSFDERMATMYGRKVEYEKCPKDPKVLAKKGCVVASDTVLSHAPKLLDNYLQADKMKMSLNDFIKVAEEKVERAKRSIDWASLCKKGYQLNAEKCELLKAIVGDLKGRDLVAYGMTELLSSDNGTLNARYMDVILRNAGAQFLYHVPALGDRYASLGLYQFTFFALRKDAEVTAGANVVNAFVHGEGEKIPGSVVMLSGHQHHTAAFYFAVNNLAWIISRLKSPEVATLARMNKQQPDAMVVIVACAHHHPGLTLSPVKTWLAAIEEARNPKPQKGKGKKAAKPAVKKEAPPLVSLFSKTADMSNYAKKSQANLVAVYNWK